MMLSILLLILLSLQSEELSKSLLYLESFSISHSEKFCIVCLGISMKLTIIYFIYFKLF